MPTPRYECCKKCYPAGRHDPAQRLAYHRQDALRAAERAAKWSYRAALADMAIVLVPVVIVVVGVICCCGFYVFRR